MPKRRGHHASKKKAATAQQQEEATGRSLPSHADLVIVGSGCHAASLLMRMLTRGEVMTDPNPPIESYRHAPKDVRRHLNKTPVEEDLKKHIVVIDRSGGWMLNWQRAYRALDIPHLRSPEGLHPDPYDHSALAVFAKNLKLENEFVQMTQLGRGKTILHKKGHGAQDEGVWYHGPFELPKVGLFAKFCKHLVDKSYGLGPLLHQGEVTGLNPLPNGAGFELEVLQGGKSKLVRMTASNVVLARGPTARQNVPSWAAPLMGSQRPPMAIAHAWEIIDSNGTSGLAPEQQVMSSAFTDAVKPTDRVVVVGGGLTSGHLVTLLAKQGVQDIKLILRGPRKLKQFDLILPWFGDDRWKKRHQFEQASIADKISAIKDDRDGGSLTPEHNAFVQSLEAQGRCEVMDFTQITSAVWIPTAPAAADASSKNGDDCAADGNHDASSSRSTGGYWEVCFDNDSDCQAEKIWLATGSRMDADTDPLLQKLLQVHPIDTHCGFPDVMPTLRWAKDVPLYVMGGLAALQLGPDAVNLAGGLRGSVRISDELKSKLKECAQQQGEQQARDTTERRRRRQQQQQQQQQQPERKEQQRQEQESEAAVSAPASEPSSTTPRIHSPVSSPIGSPTRKAQTTTGASNTFAGSKEASSCVVKARTPTTLPTAEEHEEAVAAPELSADEVATWREIETLLKSVPKQMQRDHKIRQQLLAMAPMERAQAVSRLRVAVVRTEAVRRQRQAQRATAQVRRRATQVEGVG